jgi:hypothetical protein
MDTLTHADVTLLEELLEYYPPSVIHGETTKAWDDITSRVWASATESRGGIYAGNRYYRLRALFRGKQKAEDSDGVMDAAAHQRKERVGALLETIRMRYYPLEARDGSEPSQAMAKGT